MKLAIRERLAPGETLAEKLAWIERAGLSGIELMAASLDLPRGEIEAAFSASPVRPASIDGGAGLADPDPAVRAAARGRIRARIELAGALGATGVLIVPQFGRAPAPGFASPLAGPAVTGDPADQERGLVIAAMRDLLPEARALGVRLFIEPLNRYEAWMVNRIEQGVELGDAIGPEIGVMADFFHMNIEEADPAAAIRAHAGRIVHVHLADSNRLQPGRGHLDFAANFAALRQAGYDGWFGIECRLDGPPETAIPASAEHVRRLWASGVR